MALAGVALGLLLGVPPILGALVVTLAGAVGMERMRAQGALQGDAALAVFLSGGFAVAVVLISLARGFNADLFAILFGSILTVSPATSGSSRRSARWSSVPSARSTSSSSPSP